MSGSEGVRAIGGEMIEWSDAGQDLPGGAAIEEMILRVVPAGGHVLVAGPHRTGLVDRLVEHCARVTCLLRSLPDAAELHRRHGGRDMFTTLCGDVDGLPGSVEAAGPEAGAFDAVVAAGGFGRLNTPDGPALGWAAIMRRLAATLAPGATLVIAVENELGVHRLVEPTPADTADDHWFPPYGIDGTVPASPAELVRAIDEATATDAVPTGAAAHRCYAVYPSVEAPAVLLPTGPLSDRLRADGVPAALVAAALDAGFAGRPVLADPARLARTSLANGLGARLAPGWIAVLRPSGPPPGVMVTDGPGPLAVTCELTEPGTGPGTERRWERRPVVGAETVLAGRIARDVGRLAGPVPDGCLLDQLLLTACALCDLPALRGLLRSYAGWMAELPPAAQPFATPGNVVVDDCAVSVSGSGWSLLDPSWELAEPVSGGVALTRALRGFAAGLLAGGHRHPWPTTLDVDGITSVMTTMAGRRPDRAFTGQAIRLEAEIIAARRQLPISDRERLVAELERGVLPSPMGLREALLERERLITELGEARDRSVWLDTRLRATEAKVRQAADKHAKTRAELRATQDRLEALRESTTYRIGRFIVSPKRKALRVLRTVRPSAGAATRIP